MKQEHLVRFEIDPLETTLVTPRFPNWERSFVSGPDSPLYEVEHRISNVDPTILLTLVKFKKKAEGPPGHVHGGATAGLIDEVMGVLVWHQGAYGVTEKLSLQYPRAIPISPEYSILSQIVTKDPCHSKKIEVHTTVYDQEKSPYVLAQGLFHRLTLEQLGKFKS